MRDDKYIDHPTHETYLSDCSECYKENRIIQARKLVTSHEEMLEKHPALKNSYGSNLPLGYVPE